MTGETDLSGFTVFAEYFSNHQGGGALPSTVTAPDGSWRLSGLDPDTPYFLGVEVPWTMEHSTILTWTGGSRVFPDEVFTPAGEIAGTINPPAGCPAPVISIGADTFQSVSGYPFDRYEQPGTYDLTATSCGHSLTVPGVVVRWKQLTQLKPMTIP